MEKEFIDLCDKVLDILNKAEFKGTLKDEFFRVRVITEFCKKLDQYKKPILPVEKKMKVKNCQR
jgi:hypothetical protein